jgi:predicted nucleic acid-binding protein
MRRLFADTFFYIAMLSQGDESHQRALSIYQEEDFDQIVTNAFVLTELADGMADE